MEVELRACLKANAALTALVETRIDWDERPQGKPLPAITLQLITELGDRHMGGVQATQIDRVQMDVWGGTFASAKAVRDAAVAVLEAASVQGSVRFLLITVIGGGSVREVREDGTSVFRRRVDLSVAHTPIP